VTGLAPGDTGVVSGPRYMLVNDMILRARPQLTCVPPNREGKGVNPGRAPGAARSKKGRRDQSHQSARVSWDARFPPGRKSSVSRSILARSRPRLAGSAAVDVLQGLVFFSYLISNIFVAALFERANKIMFM